MDMPPKRRKRVTAKAREAVAYVRVSTDQQQLGPDAQREAIARYARSIGVDVVAIFTEIASGAANMERRPELARALAAARTMNAGVFLVAKRDRLARDAVLSALIERDLSTDGIAVHSADGQANGDTAEAALMRGILGSMAEYERALIRARTKAALASQKARGLRSAGSVPYGMRLAADGCSLEPHPVESEIVLRIRNERVRGNTYRTILERLTRDNVPARGKRWHLTTIQRICTERSKETRAALGIV